MEPEFVKRINNPEKFPFIKREGGKVSTHGMAAEVDDTTGKWVVFPTIVQLPDGTLYEFKDSHTAMKYNLRTGNYLPMKNKTQALNYAKGGYKKNTPLENFKNE